MGSFQLEIVFEICPLLECAIPANQQLLQSEAAVTPVIVVDGIIMFFEIKDKEQNNRETKERIDLCILYFLNAFCTGIEQYICLFLVG